MAVDADALQLLGGAPPSTAAGPVGSVQQIHDAAGTPAAPVSITVHGEGAPAPGPPGAEPPPGKPPSVNLEGGIELLPSIGYAVEGVESDHQHMVGGRINTSSAGALGLMQVMPDQKGGTTRGKLDLTDEKQNKQAGMEELEEDYRKYGNWTDALMAYNWGQGHVDKWIAGGRTGPVPAETQAYVPAVLKRLGMSPGAQFVEARSAGEAKSSAHELLMEPSDGERRRPDVDSDDALTASLIGANEAPVTMDKETREESASLTWGAVQGARDLFAGPAQAGLELVAPEVAKQLTRKINEMDAPFEDAINAHPYANFAGQTIGTGVMLFAAARLFPAAAVATTLGRTVTMAARSVPSALRAMGIGGALGLTSFNKDPDNASRLAEGALGVGFGLLGQQVGNVVGKIIQRASDQQVVKNFLASVQKNLEGMEPSLSKIKDEMVSVYEKATATRNRKYTSRDAAGRELTGYPSGYAPNAEGTAVERSGVAQLVQDVREGAIGFDKNSELIKGTAKGLEQKLGLDKQEDALALWEQQMKDYEKSMDEFMKGPEGKNLRTLGERYALTLERRGVEVPRPPAPFEAQPISAEQMAEGRRFLNRELDKKPGLAQNTQIRLLKRGLDETASKTAREAGVDVASYERKQRAADKFHRETIKPLQEFFGNRTVAQAKDPNQVTKMDIYTKVINAVKKGDREELGALFKVMSPQARAEVRKAVEYDMVRSAVKPGLQDVIRPEEIAKYVAKYGHGLEEALGREEFTKLRGKAKIAEKLALEIKAEGVSGLVGHHPWLMTYAGIKLFERHPIEAARLAGGAVGIELVHNMTSALNFVPRIMGPLLPRAAKTEVNSAEMKAIMRSVDTAMNALTRSQTRLLPEATGGEPATSIGQAGQSMYYSIAGQP